MSEIFISYAREDSAFVRKMVDALKTNKREVWVDFDDIPFASEWWKEVVEGIELSSVGIFVISADSIGSQYCSLEIAELIKTKKKIVPLVTRRPSEEQIARLPQTIRNLNWVFFEDEAKFDESFANLIDALDTDLELAKEHTRLLLRANEWQRRGQSNSLLARGDELAEFLPMRKLSGLTELQASFLEKSLEQAQVQQRLWRFVFGFLGGLLGMGFYTFMQFRSGGQISPLQIVLTLAVGEVFGIFSGIIAVFANDIPQFLRRLIPHPLYLPVQMLVCLLAGMMTWITFQWFFLQLPLTLTWAAFFGGIGLSLGFIIHAAFKPLAPITFVLTAFGIYLPIFLLNSFGDIYAVSGWENPLLYFNTAGEVVSIGLPVALLFALGANGQNLYQWLFGADELTKYFNESTRMVASEE